MCSQFLRDYVPLPYLKDVQPEDIEDVSERFVSLFAEERNADRVKKVNIRGANPFFLMSLIGTQDPCGLQCMYANIPLYGVHMGCL